MTDEEAIARIMDSEAPGAWLASDYDLFKRRVIPAILAGRASGATPAPTADHMGTGDSWTTEPTPALGEEAQRATGIANRAFDGLAQRLVNELGYPWLPCPICKGVEGCDHSVPERARAALTHPAPTPGEEQP